MQLRDTHLELTYHENESESVTLTTMFAITKRHDGIFIFSTSSKTIFLKFSKIVFSGN